MKTTAKGRWKRLRDQHAVDLLFTLALFCVFAASSLMVVLIGARVYQNTADSMGENFDTRTSLTYVTTKIHQNDTAGAVRVTHLGDRPALVLRQTYGSSVYENWIYCYDGKLREVLIAQGSSFDPATGQAIMDLQDFTVERPGGNLLRLHVTDLSGRETSLTVSLRCGALDETDERSAMANGTV